MVCIMWNGTILLQETKGKKHLSLSSRKDPFPAGVILLKDAKSIDCVSEPVDNKAYCFVISTPGRDYFVTAESGKEMFDWVQILKIAKAVYCTEHPTGKLASECDVSNPFIFIISQNN